MIEIHSTTLVGHMHHL